MRILLISCFIISFTFGARAQGWMSQGARSGALANNGVTFVDALAFHQMGGSVKG